MENYLRKLWYFYGELKKIRDSYKKITLNRYNRNVSKDAFGLNLHLASELKEIRSLEDDKDCYLWSRRNNLLEEHRRNVGKLESKINGL